MKELDNNFINLNAQFEISETINFGAYDSNDEQVGTLKIENGEITYVDIVKDETIEYKDDVEKFNAFVASTNLIFRKSKERRWVEYNPNPLKKNVGDCTIRAYCKFTGKKWEEVYDMSSKFAKEECSIMDESSVVNKFIQEKLNCKIIWPKKDEKVTVNEFAKTHNKGKYIIGIRGHVVTVINGYYYDSWDSGDKKINRIFTPEN